MIKSKYRLSSSAFEARLEGTEAPGKCIFISVEGDDTERTYFENLRNHIRTLGSKTCINIEVLSHPRDGYSAPNHVAKLLEEFMKLRDEGVLPQEIRSKLKLNFTENDLNKYLSNDVSLSEDLKHDIEAKALEYGIDLHYRKYLKDYKEYDDDRFVVVIDKDRHHESVLRECMDICNKNNYELYLSNPCFEFWLLFHLCNVKERYKNQEEKIRENKHVNRNQTFVSKEVSNLAFHSKKIAYDCFCKNYWPNILKAKERADEYATEVKDLLENIGTNMGNFFDEDFKIYFKR